MTTNKTPIYTKLSLHEHILTLPDTYIGSVREDTMKLWIMDSNTDRMINKEITYVPGLYKIYDEIIVNAHDQCARDVTCNSISIDINQETGEISVWNNGNGIEIAINEKEKVYNAELIFGNLLTSSNYKQTGKTWGGKNGYGAKLANIYSTHFCVETVDAKCDKKYIQHFYRNMFDKEEPKITKAKGALSYTKITFTPDFKRFGIKGLTDDIVGLFKKRAYDIAAYNCGRVSVTLNEKRINISSYGDYIKMFFPEMNGDVTQMTYREVNDCWKIGIVYTPNSGFSHVSHVNGIWTYSQTGGTHVQHVIEQIIKGLMEYIKKHYKNLDVKPSYIKDNMTIFVNCVTTDPDFNSQTKECLTTKSTSFLKKCVIDDSLITTISKMGIVTDAIAFAQLKGESELKKINGKKVKRIDVDKLTEAKCAGTKNSLKCRLIITEGDSAKSFALNGLDVIGRDYYGVFPIRGKMLNVRDATHKKILENKEIVNIMQILGLQHKVKYNETNINKLRYGGILVLTDADVDGSHIKGLIINFIHCFWPELLQIDGFFQTIMTPIIIASKHTSNEQKKIFYTLSEYNKWSEEVGDNLHKWSIKYYKGLGTSTDREAREAFTDFGTKLISYKWEKPTEKDIDPIAVAYYNLTINIDDASNDSEKIPDKQTGKQLKSKKKSTKMCDRTTLSPDIINSKSNTSLLLAFAKELADDRKDWLNTYDKDIIIEPINNSITYSDFVNKDLIHFSHYDNTRSIPSLCDGLKPSQRKILFTMIDKKYDKKSKEQKVQGLASAVQKRTSYVHGEASLFEAIVKMAQKFVGSNNINLLYPDGCFGSRRVGGKDASAPRYIFSYLEKLTNLIFRKEDEPIYNYLIEEGILIEPDVMAPIIPLILVNGTTGIGTGYSTDIPCFNPQDIIENLMRMLDDDEPYSMTPWYKGFSGDIIVDKKNDANFITRGKYEFVKGNENVIRITELPIGTWTDDYETFLKSIMIDAKKPDTKQIIENYDNSSGNNSIDFLVEFSGSNLQTLIKGNTLMSALKLDGKISTKNMALHDETGKIIVYDNADDILRDFFKFRLDMYVKRKKYYTRVLQNDMNILKYKIKFIRKVCNRDIIIEKKKKTEIITELIELGFPKLSRDINAINDDSTDGKQQHQDDVDDEVITVKQSNKTYDYITTLPLFSLTYEKIEELKKQYNEKENELKLYEQTSPHDIWKMELKELMVAYNEWYTSELNEMHEMSGKIKPKSNKTKNAPKKQRA